MIGYILNASKVPKVANCWSHGGELSNVVLFVLFALIALFAPGPVCSVCQS